MTVRVARTQVADLARIAAYLPSNYTAVESDGCTLIVGEDVAGWTLDGYVIPRLESGLIFAGEIEVPACFSWNG